MGELLRSASTEVRRAFTGRSFLLSVACGMILVAWHTSARVLPRARLNQSVPVGTYPFSLHQLWMGMDGSSDAGGVYMYLVPLLAAIPYGASLFDDRRSGYDIQMVTRTKRMNYYLAKQGAVFLSGGVASIVPLITSFGVTALFVPALKPLPITGTFSLWASSVGADVYYAEPFLYFVGGLTIVFLWGGAMALLAVLAGHFLSIRVMVLVFPLLLLFFVEFVCASVNPDAVLLRYSPFSFVRLNQPIIGMSLSVILVEWLGVVAFTTAVLLVRARQDEAL